MITSYNLKLNLVSFLAILPFQKATSTLNLSLIEFTFLDMFFSMSKNFYVLKIPFYPLVPHYQLQTLIFVLFLFGCLICYTYLLPAHHSLLLHFPCLHFLLFHHNPLPLLLVNPHYHLLSSLFHSPLSHFCSLFQHQHPHLCTILHLFLHPSCQALSLQYLLPQPHLILILSLPYLQMILFLFLPQTQLTLPLFLAQIHILWLLDPRQVSSNPRPMPLNLLPLIRP